jgi:hypothetical protein
MVCRRQIKSFGTGVRNPFIGHIRSRDHEDAV